MPFSAPGFHIVLIVMSVYAPLGWGSISDTACVLWPWQILGCWSSILLNFLQWVYISDASFVVRWGCGLWGGKAQRQMSFSSCHNPGSMLTWSITVDGNLHCLVEEALCQFPRRFSTPCPQFHTIRLEGSQYLQLTLKEGGKGGGAGLSSRHPGRRQEDHPRP